MTVLLDTQVLIMAYLGEGLPRKVQALLANPETDRLVSAISFVEVAIKKQAGKIEMGAGDLQVACRDLSVRVVAFTPRQAVRMFELGVGHRDPFDRMIIATALSEGIALVSRDRQFKGYAGLKIIW